ncbi:MAG: helix-turn-helix domain-containing protein, partial [Saprospiraceae bacterium]|nr:helix-turn-helix domain-containing protein [Saprospiraceae bacterium]
MQELSPTEKKFLERVQKTLEEQLANEKFGVSELAGKLGMSRSNLLRKIKSITGLSANKYIRQLRLEHAVELFKKQSPTVSEVAYKTGFSSTSYFIKCFKDEFGYPPGEASKSGFQDIETQLVNPSRQLVAIMFTDIQGYTALMQKDEEKAMQMRSRHRQIFNSTTEKYQGRILQYYGDGTLSTFHSAIDAVNCAIQMQRSFLEDPEIPVRIGIHSGDIILKDDDIIGDGVNVASRIESLAVSGSILISGKVYDEVKNQTDINTVSLGPFHLKNVGKPIEIFSIANPGLVVPRRENIEGKLDSEVTSLNEPVARKSWTSWLPWIITAAFALLALYIINSNDMVKSGDREQVQLDRKLMEKSIAVLPFINDSGDSSNVYIINGLMESILNHLQRIDDLRVVSRTSSEKYRNVDKSIPEIAEELGVRYFVEGSGQKLGEQILLSIQVIDGSTDEHLWSGQFNRETKDIFNLQSEIAKKIANEIEVIVSPKVIAQIEKIPTSNLKAYDLYMQAREYMYMGGEENLFTAIDLYQEAIDLDPEFANAYAGISTTYFFMEFGQANPKYTYLVNENADKALLYDPESAPSLIAKAVY